ncbi:hypothetical protein GE09DRAFT_1055545 [Coniochaeta sp. 2T2.1]|nr:hypothetical protein GE09DRAFT_1055545 [Coniochaeta sp. 2T2.1]
MAPLTELSKISIAEIIVYTPSLAIATFLAVRHGFGRSSGWLYLIIFSLARVLGGALQLAAINDPANIGLLTGAATLQSIGISPLILCMLGLLSRVLESIRQTRDTFTTPQMIRIVQIVVLVALILGIVGGSEMGDIVRDAIASGSTSYAVPTESVAGLALMMASFAILIIASGLTARQIGAAEPGEKRLLLAIALAAPFVLVRLVFAAVGTFGDHPDFRAFLGTDRYPDLLVGMAVVMEMAAVAIFEGVGLTLRKVQRPVAASGRMEEGEGIPLGSRGRHSRSPSKDVQRSGVERA